MVSILFKQKYLFQLLKCIFNHVIHFEIDTLRHYHEMFAAIKSHDHVSFHFLYEWSMQEESFNHEMSCYKGTELENLKGILHIVILFTVL